RTISKLEIGPSTRKSIFEPSTNGVAGIANRPKARESTTARNPGESDEKARKLLDACGMTPETLRNRESSASNEFPALTLGVRSSSQVQYFVFLDYGICGTCSLRNLGRTAPAGTKVDLFLARFPKNSPQWSNNVGRKVRKRRLRRRLMRQFSEVLAV